MTSKQLFTATVLVSLAVLIGSVHPALARRAYSYGGGSDTTVSAPHPHAADNSKAHVTASSEKKAPRLKKSHESTGEPVADAQKLSVLNVFAPAPVPTATPAKHAASAKVDRKAVEKSGSAASTSSVNRKPQ